MVLSVAGLDHKDAVAMAEKYFGGVPQKSSVPGIEEIRESQRQPAVYVGGQSLKRSKTYPLHMLHWGSMQEAGMEMTSYRYVFCIVCWAEGTLLALGGQGKGCTRVFIDRC